MISSFHHSLAPVSTSSEESSPAGRSSPARLSASHRAASLLEPDNNSFFSAGFTKVNPTPSNSGNFILLLGKTHCLFYMHIQSVNVTHLLCFLCFFCTVSNNDWAPNGVPLPHMPDVLPSVHSSEDWQAAFGFGSNNSVSDTKQTSAAAMLAKYQAWLGLAGQQKLENSGVNLVNPNSVPVSTEHPYSHQSSAFGAVRVPEGSSILMHNAFQQQQQQQHQQQSFLVHLQQQQAMRLQHGSHTSAGPEVGFPAGDFNRENIISNGPSDRADAFLHYGQRSSTNSILNTSQEDYFNNSDSERRHTDDDLGFDPFHETQKGLAEMMEKEQLLKQQQQLQQQNHIHLQQQQHHQQLLQQAHLAALNQHSYQQHNPLYHRYVKFECTNLAFPLPMTDVQIRAFCVFPD